MKGIAKDKLGLIFLGYSALLSCLIIVFRYFPFSGFAFLFASLSSFVYFLKEEKSKFTTTLYLLTIILSSFFIYRSSEFLLFLNLLSIVFFGGLMAMPKGFYERGFAFIHFVQTPFLLTYQSIKNKNEFAVNFQTLFKTKFNFANKKNFKTILSVAVSILILLIILPLLASANPLFAKYLSSIISFLNLEKLLEKFFSDSFFIWVLRMAAFIVFAYLIPRFISLVRQNTVFEKVKLPDLNIINFNLPKAITSFVLFAFFLTQLQLYFSNSDTLLAMGITHSAYTREVFFQLLIVAIVILGLIYNAKEKGISANVLTFILLFEGAFLTFIALKSVYDYSLYWGLTHKRLWGYTVVFWLLGVFVIYIYGYLKEFKNSIFVRSVIVFSGLVLILVNILNFDFLIFHLRKSVTHHGVDYIYLSRLSPDSMAYAKLFKIIEKEIKYKDVYTRKGYTYTYAGNILLRKIDYLKEKYKKIDFRTFNLSEYLEYRRVKSIDTELYRQLWIPANTNFYLQPNGGES